MFGAVTGGQRQGVAAGRKSLRPRALGVRGGGRPSSSGCRNPSSAARREVDRSPVVRVDELSVLHNSVPWYVRHRER